MDVAGQKRKHVEFNGEPAPSASGSTGTGVGYIHPSRQAIHLPPPPKKAKEKTAAKKRYLAKKAKRHKVLSKAKKAAAPKDKEWNGDAGEDSDSDSDDDSSEEEEKSSVAGPSRLPASVPIPAPTSAPITPEVEVKDSKKREKEKKAKKEKKENKETKDKSSSSEDVKAVEEEPLIVDEAAERERRRIEKKEKRANRDHEAKRQRKEERRRAREAEKKKAEAAAAKGKAKAEAAAAVGDGEVAQDVDMDGTASESEEEEEDGSEKDEEEDVIDARSDRISPPLLEAFPLPTPAPAPDPLLLSRQGLPQNLENATIVDQNLRTGLEDIEVPYKEGVVKGVGERLAGRLKDMGVTDFFAVQAAILPHLLPLPRIPNPFEPLNDYLISAPTGSGKTLAYAIPIIKALEGRKQIRLRTLIVLPTRDLVAQVRETMEGLAKGTGLVIGSATGQHNFSHEQNQLIADRETKLLGGSSKVDILIATPGRLIDHLTKTPNFTLQHLRFLVIDEADRLLNQSFHNWLQQVLSHTRPPTEPIDLPEGFVRKPWDLVATEWQTAFGMTDMSSEWYRPPLSTCQKLLFSATLTRDPAAIASLALRNPQYFIVQQSDQSALTLTPSETFALPSTLTEKYLVVPPALKPLNLVHLCHKMGVRGGLVFVKSVESVGRLVALLTAFEDAYNGGEKKKKISVKGYTSDMKPGERKAALADFTAGKIDLLISSDVIARGLDLPSIAHVISYDTPVDMRKYVHRVGRTARAGREGTAWTLCEKQEALHFKGMLKAAGREKAVKKIKVKEEELEGYKASYERALAKVKDIYVRHEST